MTGVAMPTIALNSGSMADVWRGMDISQTTYSAAAHTTRGTISVVLPDDLAKVAYGMAISVWRIKRDINGRRQLLIQYLSKVCHKYSINAQHNTYA